MFLSVVDKIDNELKEGRATVAETTDLACLLHLTEEFTHCGPLRNCWDGGPAAEAISKTLKPVINSGLTQSGWSKSATLKFYKLMAMKHLTGRSHDNGTVHALDDNDLHGQDLDQEEICNLEENRQQEIAEEMLLTDPNEPKRQQ